MIDFTVLSSALNKVILPTVKFQLYSRAPMWQLLGGWTTKEVDPNTGLFGVAKRANVNVNRFENNKMYVPIMTGNMAGVVGIGVGEKYNYGDPTLNETFQSIKILVGSFTIPKALLNTTDRGAIVKPLLFSSDQLSRALAMDANRQVYGSGDGVVGTANATQGTGSTAFVFAASTNGDIDYSRYTPKGTRIKIGSNAITTVAAVTGDNTITLTDAQTWTAGDGVVKVTGSNTTSAELDGFKSMIAASGSYQNLATSAEGSWKSYVDSTAETITKANIVTKMHNAFFKANKVGRVNWIVMNSKAFQVYGAALEDRIKLASSKEVLSGGWLGLEYMGGNAQILLDYDMPDDRIYFLSSEDLVFGEFQPLEFERGTDGTLLKITQQLDYEVTASWMGNIGTTSRASNAAMTNKTFS